MRKRILIEGLRGQNTEPLVGVPVCVSQPPVGLVNPWNISPAVK